MNALPFKQAPAVQQKAIGAHSVSQDEDLRGLADEAQKGGYFDKAIGLYKEALAINPDNHEANLSLAKTYKLNFDYQNAIEYFEKAEKHNPSDIENITVLGECYKNIGQYKNAERHFLKVLKIDPNYDYANRNLLDTRNLMLACVNPQRAFKERQDAALQNLNTAIAMATGFLPKSTLKNIQDVNIMFDKTAQMGGRSNIAQYEHNGGKNRKITILDEYIYANPVITGTYIVHEAGVHANDNDPYTSVTEEQDAYKIQAQFWLKHAKNVEDPEMDYVADLYKKSPQSLANRVEEIYRLRDPNIARVSPNHPPGTKKLAACGLQTDQPLKAYDVIV